MVISDLDSHRWGQDSFGEAGMTGNHAVANSARLGLTQLSLSSSLGYRHPVNELAC